MESILSLSLSVYVYMYIYIHTHTHTHMNYIHLFMNFPGGAGCKEPVVTGNVSSIPWARNICISYR